MGIIQKIIKDKKDNIIKFVKIYWPIILSGIFIAYEAFAYDIRSGDFEAKYRLMGNSPILDFIIKIYPRFIVDNIVPYLLSHSLLLFAIVVIISVSSILYNFSKILKINDIRFNILSSLAFVVLFPFGPVMASAGSFATICVYLFPAAALLYGVRILFDDKSNKHQNILKILALFFAANQEQFAVALCILFLGYFIYNYKIKKSISFLKYFAFIIILISTALSFIGDFLHRGHDEMMLYFPDFQKISLIRKIDIGFIDTMQHFFVNPFFIIIAILILILIISIRTKKMIPGFIAVTQLYLLSTFKTNEIVTKINDVLISWNIKDYGKTLSSNGITRTSIHSFASMQPDVYFIIMSTLFIISLMYILKTNKERIMIGFVLFIGLATRMIMSFSPTIYASSDRTFFVMLLTLFFVFLYLSKKIFFNDINLKNEKLKIT